MNTRPSFGSGFERRILELHQRDRFIKAAAARGIFGVGQRLLGAGKTPKLLGAGGASGNPNWMFNRLGLGPAVGGAGGRFGGAIDWLNQNKQTVKNVGLFGGGMAADHGIDEFGDYRKREAIRNMGFGDRLGMAYRMLTNPDQIAGLI